MLVPTSPPTHTQIERITAGLFCVQCAESMAPKLVVAHARSGARSPLICVQRLPVRDDIDLLCRNTRAFECHFQRRTRRVRAEWKRELEVGRSQKHIFDVKSDIQMSKEWNLRHAEGRSAAAS